MHGARIVDKCIRHDEIQSTFEYFIECCVHDIQCHLQRLSGKFNLIYGSGERTVDKSYDHFGLWILE